MAAPAEIWISISLICKNCSKEGKPVLKTFKKCAEIETCGVLLNRVLPENHASCKISKVRAGFPTASPQNHDYDCDTNTPIEALRTFGRLSVIVEIEENDLNERDARTSSNQKSALDVLMNMRRSYIHLPKQR